MISCEISLFVYGSKPGRHFARNLREFGVARSRFVANQSARKTLSTVLVYTKNGYSQRQSSYPSTRSVVCTFNKTKGSSFTSSPSGDNDRIFVRRLLGIVVIEVRSNNDLHLNFID